MPAFPAPPFVPTITTVNRLSFVRYLYQVAVQQSDQPSPMAVAAVLTFHDAVDLFVQLLVETLKIPKPKKAYMMDLLAEIEKKLVNPPSHTVAMSRLNDARNSLKHSGLHPARSEIEGFRASATNFFEDYSQLVFGVRFGSLSMVDLVANARVRERLQKAESELAQEAYEQAAVDLAWSFEVLVKDYEEERVNRFGRARRQFSPLDWKEFREITDAIEGVQAQVRILALGLDLHSYVAFEQLVPRAWWYINSEEPAFHEGQTKEPASEAGCRFCLDFVVETALRLQGSPFVDRQAQ